MKSDRIYIEHMIDCIDKIYEYTKDDKSLFVNSTIVHDAVLRNLHTLTESSQRLSDKIKQDNSIDWRAMSGFRNILVHDYLGTDLELIWRVIENRLPVLRRSLEEILQKISD